MRAVLVLFLLLLAAASVPIAHAQENQPILRCPSATTVQSIVATVSALTLLAIILIVVLLVIFNFLGVISNIISRIASFFLEKILFIFELTIIYLFFLHNLGNAIRDQGGCAHVDWQTLLSSGPIFYRILGLVLSWLGISP